MIRQRLTWIFTVLIMAAFSSTIALAQSGYGSEQDMIRQAERFFNEKKFDKALPLFSTIVSNKPADPKMNYYLGACIIEAGTDKTEALRFLETATQSPLVPVDAWFYLGKAYHASYRYEEALTSYEAFRINTSKATWNNLQGEQLITMCKNGIAATNNIEKTAVHRILKKEELPVNDLNTGYKFNEPSGRLLKLPKEYELKETKGNPECEYLFLNAAGTQIVYSNKAGKSKKGFEIYHVEKDAKGLWGFPKLFGPEINSPADEAYPVISNDGNTLYFSSNGPSSTGGYDIFKSELNAATGKWSAPVNMGTPVNSPGDDFYYVQSKDNTYAYFASGRESITGKCNLYKVSVVDETRNFTSVKGVFNCPSKLELVEAKITIYDARDGGILSEFKTPSRTGQYAVKLPVPSSLIYQVQLTGFESHKGQIELKENIQQELCQEILLIREESGKEKMTIITISPEQLAEKANPENQEQPLVSIMKKPETKDEPNQLLEVSEKNRVFIPEQEKTSNVDKTVTRETSAKSKVNPTKERNEPIVTIIKPDTILTAEQIMEQTLREQELNAEKKKKPVTTESTKSFKETAVQKDLPVQSKETTQIKEKHVPVKDTPQISESTAAPLVSVINTEEKKSTTSNLTLLPDKSVCVPVHTLAPQFISPVNIPGILVARNGSTAMVMHSVNEEVTVQSENKDVNPNPGAADVIPLETVILASDNKGVEIVSTLESKKNEYILTSMFAGKELVFRVQLGVFGKKTEEELKKKFAERGITDVVIQQNEKGLLQVLMGDEENYGDALALKETLVSQGMNDAFVVVFTSGVQVPIDLVVRKE